MRVRLDDTKKPSSNVSAITLLPSYGVAGSPVLPTTMIGPAPLPVIANRVRSRTAAATRRRAARTPACTGSSTRPRSPPAPRRPLDGGVARLHRRIVGARDGEVRLQLVAVRAVRTTPVVLVVQLEDAGRRHRPVPPRARRRAAATATPRTAPARRRDRRRRRRARAAVGSSGSGSRRATPRAPRTHPRRHRRC